MNDRTYDLIVFGATSFVGQILCRFLVERHGNRGELRWAIAGRNAEKLETVASETGAEVPHIVADAADGGALAELAQSTRLVISTVGPYAQYGSPLVAAAVNAGTDYCDLAGEPHWMQQMIDTHQPAAEASGARIVHACGFDSIPSDLGVLFTQDRAVEALGRPCQEIRMQVRAAKGGPSGGTVASMINTIEEVSSDPQLRKVLGNPYALAPQGQRTGKRQPNVVKPQQGPGGTWLAPFVMAAINTKVVFRTHALLGYPWGDDFTYDESMSMGEGPAGLAKAAALTGGLGAFMGAAAIGPTRNLLSRFVLPKPGEGPSPEAQERGYFKLRFDGTTASGDTITTEVTGDRDPGYGSTAKMIGTAATTLLATSREATPGGFWTPASAMGTALIGSLQADAGLDFSVR